MHEHSEFVTLTYDDESVPVDHSLRYSDFQKFMKRLRRRFGSMRQRRPFGDKELSHGLPSGRLEERCGARSAISFYMCGEYGETTFRPHYHACLFGVRFSDRVLFKRSDAGHVYTSKLLDDLWSLGHCTTGDVTFESAAYVARYITTKVTGNAADEHYKCVDENGEVYWRKPEFNRMSLNPAIGYRWFEKYKSDVYPSDEVVVRGRVMKPPKAYDRLLERSDFDLREALSWERIAEYQRRALDATPDRLRVREVVARARLNLKRRNLE